MVSNLRPLLRWLLVCLGASIVRTCCWCVLAPPSPQSPTCCQASLWSWQRKVRQKRMIQTVQTWGCALQGARAGVPLTGSGQPRSIS